MKNENIRWSDVNAALKSGKVKGVPANTDLEDFIWQKFPESRKEIENRNPGRIFTKKEMGKR